jgi:hypothetical protein
MGYDVHQLRRAIRGFHPGIQLTNQITAEEMTGYGGDRHKAGLFLLLIVILQSVHPNPGPPKNPTTAKSFLTCEEKETFNSIRNKEDKLVRMESHLRFLRQCQDENIIPPGFQGMRVKGVSAVTSDKGSINDQVGRTVMTSTLRHYELSIPKLREELSWSYDSLKNMSNPMRYQELQKDLEIFCNKIQKRLKTRGSPNP